MSRPRALVDGLCAALAMLASCTPVGSGAVESIGANDASIDETADAAVADGGTVDASVAIRTPCPIEASGRCRPVQVGDLVSLVEARGLCMPGFAHSAPGGGVLTYSFCLDTQILIRARTDDLVHVAETDDVFHAVSGVTGAVVNGHPTMYFARTAQGVTALNALSLDEPGATPSTLTLTGATTAPTWPQAAARVDDDEVLIAYVESQNRAFLARGRDDELTVTDAPTAPPPLRGVLAHAGTTARGRWVLTHQSADAQWLFTAFVQLETAGGWTDPIVVQPEQNNVHDAFPIARLDEGADVYYLRAPAAGQFLSAYRRYLSEDGDLGPEQVVTDLDVGHVEKPQPRRLPDGRIALTMARRITQQRYDVVLAILEGDAPKP